MAKYTLRRLLLITVFLIASATFFLLAGMLLLKSKKPEEFSTENGWRRHFRTAGPKSVLAASLADYLQRL